MVLRIPAMRRALLLLPLALVVACADGRGVVQVTVTAQPSVPGIDHLSVDATMGASVAGPYTIAMPHAPATLPPEQTFTLSFAMASAGAIVVHVEARDASDQVLARGSESGQLSPSTLSQVRVVLTPVPP